MPLSTTVRKEFNKKARFLKSLPIFRKLTARRRKSHGAPLDPNKRIANSKSTLLKAGVETTPSTIGKAVVEPPRQTVVGKGAFCCACSCLSPLVHLPPLLTLLLPLFSFTLLQE